MKKGKVGCMESLDECESESVLPPHKTRYFTVTLSKSEAIMISLLTWTFSIFTGDRISSHWGAFLLSGIQKQNVFAPQLVSLILRDKHIRPSNVTNEPTI